jgi:tRNA pseudouridine38-40 synthase
LTARLLLEYDGAGFAGWARQPGLRTVQGELEGALERILGEPVRLTVAGRTDAGVHAWGQVASFQAPGDAPEDLARGLNALTGDDLAVTGAELVAPGFDARRHARSRTYCYRVLAAPVPSPFDADLALYWPHRVEPEALERCASGVPGVHDFTAFTPTQTEHVRFERRVVRSEWRREEGSEDVWRYWIEADAFMRNMVRVLIGTMLGVAGGRRDVTQVCRLLEGAPRADAGETAPAHGLYLASVSY